MHVISSDDMKEINDKLNIKKSCRRKIDVCNIKLFLVFVS